MNKIKTIYNKLSFLIIILILCSFLIDIRLALISIICITGPIIYAFLTKKHGRLWCRYICPRGNLFNRVGPYLRKRSVPKILKTVFVRLLIILCLFSMFGFAVYKNYDDLNEFSISLYQIVLITTWIGLFMAYIFYPRSWCAICPIGSIIDIIEYKKKNKKGEI